MPSDGIVRAGEILVVLCGGVARRRQRGPVTETGHVIDLDYLLVLIDGAEDAVPAGPQAPQVRRPVGE